MLLAGKDGNITDIRPDVKECLCLQHIKDFVNHLKFLPLIIIEIKHLHRYDALIAFFAQKLNPKIPGLHEYFAVFDDDPPNVCFRQKLRILV